MDDRIITTHSLKQIMDRMYPDLINRQQVTAMLQTLKRYRKISLKEVADLILYIADTSHRTWNIEVILNSINEVFDSINWRGVYEKFLEDDLKIWNTEYLYTLVDCWVHISGIITVPYEVFFRKWSNRENQIGFMKILLDAEDKRTQVYSNIFFEKIVTKEELRSSKYKRTLEYESNLNSVELFRSIKSIDSVELIDMIKDKSPEYCILGLAAVAPYCEEIFDELLVSFSEGSTSNFVYFILFSKHSQMMLHAFKRVSVSLTKMLDIFLEHKMLPVVAEVAEPADLCFDVVILSSRRDHLNLEIWLGNNFERQADVFVGYLYNKVLFHTRSRISSTKEENIITLIESKKMSTLKSDTEIFPFNKSILGSVLRMIDMKMLNEDSQMKVREIQTKLSEYKMFDRPTSSDRATLFISEIINSHVEVEDSIFKLKELLRGDETANILVKRIFGLLIDNYSSLYKLPNSDMLAVFFGELIKRRIFLKPFMTVALQLIKNSLKFPESEREFSFAFRILEIFFNEVPDFFIEIEEIESVLNGLIKKELILVDECNDSKCAIVDNRIDIGDNIIDSKCGNKDMIDSCISECIDNDHNRDVINCIDYTISINTMDTDTFQKTASNIFNNLETSAGLVPSIIKNEPFRKYIVQLGFSIIRNSFMHSINKEFYKLLGTFLGSIVIAINKTVELDLFDFKSFILKSIEFRRITVCVYFTVNFLREGQKGIIFIPKNPWLMTILELLSELHSCTLMNIRMYISELFHHFNIKLISKPSYRMKEHLMKYSIDYDGFLKQVISSALDFSVREICSKIVRSSLSVAKATAVAIEMRDSCGFFMFRNLLVNLVRALIHITAQEPLKASICGNVTHFLKLSMNELPLDEVYRIAVCNLKICCSLIEKVGITQVNEMALSLYNDNNRNINDTHDTHISDNNDDISNSCINNNISNSCINNINDNSCINDNLHKLETNNINICNNSNTSNSNINNNINTPQLRIINQSLFVEKTNIRSIENSEYQEIRSFLIQIGRKMPIKKTDYITQEWPSLLNKDKFNNFSKMLTYLNTSTDKDEHCLSLSKYLVGHAIKNNCSEDFIFAFIAEILIISHKTKKEVIGWLIYSEDSKRYNIPLIKKFIEYNLIYLEEYDQALSKFLRQDDSKSLTFTLDLLSALILKDIKLCTVYDFIHTIEMLNKMNDNPRVFDFFKKIELGMMRFNEAAIEFHIFDDFISNTKFNIGSDSILIKFKQKYKIENLCFRNALKSSWHHFVLYSGSYRFFKIDILPYLIKENLYSNLKESLHFLIQAYSKRHYLFFTFYCRFFIKVLDVIDDSVENRTLIYKILESLSPSNLPSFTSQFLEIINHPFISKYFEKIESFFIYKDLLDMLKYNKKLEPAITAAFSKNNTKKFNLYLNYLCPQECVNLKNLFNQSRPRSIIENGSNLYFSVFYHLCKQIKIDAPFHILIDNLNEQTANTTSAIDALRSILDRKSHSREIVLMLMIRKSGLNVPIGVKLACDELLNRNDIKSILDEYEAKFYNKL